MTRPYDEPLLIPTVHINGTSKSYLVTDHMAAINAVNEALKAVQAMAPHGRDYYLQDVPGRRSKIQDALEQHNARLTKLQIVAGELMHICEKIIDQQESWRLKKVAENAS